MDSAAGLIIAVLAAMLAFAGASKLREPAGIAGFLSSLGLGAASLPLVAYGVGAIELALAALLLIPQTARFGAAMIGGLMVAYAAAMTALLIRGDRPDCRCFGQSEAAPISWRSVARNLFIAAAAFVSVELRTEPGSLTAYVHSQLAGEFTVLLLTGLLILAGFHYQLLRQHGRIILQLSEIEKRLSAHGQLPISDLEIGAEAPWFTGHDPDGNEHDLESVLAGKQRLLLLFSDPGCPVCGTVVARVKDWIEGQPETALVLLNGKENHSQNEKMLILQVDQQVYQDYNIRGVPTIVALDRHGRVERRSAIGPDAIQHLCATLEQPVVVAP